jgi:hypothetical protein
VAFFIHCCPHITVGLHASLDRRHATYASTRGTLSGVIPPYQVSHLASFPRGMVGVSHPPIGKGNVMEDLRVSPCGTRHSGVNKVIPSPWLVEEADEQRSHRHANWLALVLDPDTICI